MKDVRLRRHVCHVYVPYCRVCNLIMFGEGAYISMNTVFIYAEVTLLIDKLCSEASGEAARAVQG